MKQLQRWALVLCIGWMSIASACVRYMPQAQPEPQVITGQEQEQEQAQGQGQGQEREPTEVLSSAVPTAGPTRVSIPSPAYPGIYVGTPTPNPTPDTLADNTGLETYVVQAGQTLGWIALVFGCTVDEIVAANNLANADSISAGQTLVIPVAASETGPALKLIPDSELVYGPGYIHFDLPGFIAEQGGYLANYTENVEGRLLTGPEIIQLISQRFSVGPRPLLALLELRSGWVANSQPAAATLAYPLAHSQEYQEGLFQQLRWAAARLNGSYYGWKYGDHTTMRIADGTRVAIAPSLNPGTAGVQNCLAELSATMDEWLALVGPNGFLATYERLFGYPFDYTVDPLVEPDLTQPELRLPWEDGTTWYLTSGPHGGWGNDNDRSALDFAPGSGPLGCTPSNQWATAAAPGLVLRSEDGQVIIDLDGDGFEQSGWVLFYLHLYAEGRVEAGTFVARGQRIGRPSCEGGYSEATHLHFARRYNGEWISAGDGSLPMVLSGWTAHSDVMPYDGTVTKGNETRTACECWQDDFNGLVSDNGP